MKRLTDKQKALLQEFAPQIAEYRSLQAKADKLTENVSSYESAEVARYWQGCAADALSAVMFWVGESYASVPYKAPRDKAIDAFMMLVMEGK